MNAIYTQSFKIQAVEKALNRANGISLKTIVDELGMGYSTLAKWMRDAKNNKLEYAENGHNLMSNGRKIEKRPQDWSLDDRLEIVMACASLGEEETSEYCRKHGVYPHHVNQWQLDFASGNSSTEKANSRQAMKVLKNENRALRKELNRKDRALAETAALLVLQKKVHDIWGNGEDNSQ
jgi:transposase-like protein